jgi:hypothetical protein
MHFTQDQHFSSLHFTSLHVTALHYTSIPIFHFPALLDISSLRFKSPSFLLTSNYFLVLKHAQDRPQGIYRAWRYKSCSTRYKRMDRLRLRTNKLRYWIKLAPQDNRKSRGFALQMLNIGARWGGWSPSGPGRFNPRKETRHPLYRGWVGRRAGLDGCGKSRLRYWAG